MIHDIQVAVDTGVDPIYFGRFQAGRDKLLVRSVAQRGQTEDRRNIVVNALLAAGAIAGSASIAGPSDYKTAVAVFQGAFIPGLTTLFPDHTVEQLNHINDLVFSSSSTSKVLVPVQGSVPLVTFIAEKPIEQLPFAWCGQKPLKHRNCGLDEPAYPIGTTSGTANKLTATEESVNKQSDREGWGDLPFRSWKPAALRVLEQQAFVVIGGVHIKQLLPEPAKITSLDCTTLADGSVDITQTKDGVVSCSVTGNSLDKVNSVVLRGTNDIPGKIKTAKDGNSATLLFDPATLSDNSGLYSLNFVDKSGNKTDAGESVQLSVQPFITKVKESTLNLQQNPALLTLQGKHLDRIDPDAVSLVPDETAGGVVKAAIPTSPSATATETTLSFGPTNLSGLLPEKQFHLRYATKADPTHSIDLKSIVVKTSGTAESSAPEPVITKIKESTLDITKTSPSITLEGENLAQLEPSGFTLVSDNPPTKEVHGTITQRPSSGTEVSIIFRASDFVGVSSGRQFHVKYSIKTNPSKVIELKSIAVKIVGASTAVPKHQ